MTEKLDGVFNDKTGAAADAAKPDCLLVIDVGAGSPEARMDIEQHKGFFDALGARVTAARKDGIPVQWACIQANPEFYPADTSNVPPHRLSKDELMERGFWDPADHDSEHNKVCADFFEKFGPMSNEVTCRKDNFSTYDVPEFAEHSKNFNRPEIVGGMSSHCIRKNAVAAAALGKDPSVNLDLVLSWADDLGGRRPNPEDKTFWRMPGMTETESIGLHAKKVIRGEGAEEAFPDIRLTSNSDFTLNQNTAAKPAPAARAFSRR